MSQLIAITGKGGVGKTTVAALLIDCLIEKGCRPVLAVDADPNMCLDATLGVQVQRTVGGIREEAREIAGKGMSVGVSKQELLEMKIAECLVEAENFDLIAMGRSEGPGCYCYANNVLKSILNSISLHYPYVVVDNEAGLENLSRRIVQDVQLLVMVTDSSKRGLETIYRLHNLANEMQLKYNRLVLLINRVRTNILPKQFHEAEKEIGADILLGLPENHEILEFSETGRNIRFLSRDNPILNQLTKLLAHSKLLK